MTTKKLGSTRHIKHFKNIHKYILNNHTHSILILSILFILLILALFFNSGTSPAFTPQPVVCVHHDCFEVEIADTPQKRAIGLMNQTNLGHNEGMLFVYTQPQQVYFWMKDTLIPLDILWIQDGAVIHVENDVPPCKPHTTCPVYGTDKPAQYVLEVSAQHNFTVGMKATFKNVE